MSKHRRKTRHRQIAIAAVALSALAIPSAAMACSNDPGSEDAASHGHWRTWKNASLKERRAGEWISHRSARTWRTAGAPASTAAPTPSTPASTAPAKPTAPASTAPAKPTAPAATAPAKPRTPTASSPSAPSTAAPASSAVARVVALVNSERSKAGCSPVTLNAKLSKAAQDHSADMASHQNMSHTGSDGSDPGQRITRAGYTWSAYGENVAYGYSTPEQVMAGWMASPGHKANILTCDFKEIGVGLAQPGNYWTQDFGLAR
ncbi:CAP domain-containing protein [Streptomyces sp. NPDC050564]|uniref:CAP domain-containing protein n=1 Tax=Streptomyces sp. NPDC050564 TaxID=3365631 RepID=UPI0037B32EFB